MKKRLKKLSCCWLAVIMILTMIPMNVFAELTSVTARLIFKLDDANSPNFEYVNNKSTEYAVTIDSALNENTAIMNEVALATQAGYELDGWKLWRGYESGGVMTAIESIFTPEKLPVNGAVSESKYNNIAPTGSDVLAIEPLFKLKSQSSNGSGGGGSSILYNIKFESNGGSKVIPKKIIRNYKLPKPTDPTKNGYEFDGWYADKELENEYDFENKVTKSFTLYAKWVSADNSEKDDSAADINTDIGLGGHDCPSLDYYDLDNNKWYHWDTDYVIENNIFKGTAEKIFAPDENMTRAMMITVLYRAEGEPEVTGETTFTDIDKNDYYYNALIWAQQNEIVKGYSETEFIPYLPITREQIATIMYRYASYKEYVIFVDKKTNLKSYEDYNEISEYALAAMEYAVATGMIEGRTKTTLNPKEYAKRVELAAMLHRFLESNK